MPVRPAAAGMSVGALDAAADFAQAHDSTWPYSLFLEDGRYIGTAYVGDKPPHDQPIGIVRPRGGPAGVVIRGGRIAARWGDIARADTTYSAAKSYIGLMAGIACDDGLIRSLDDRVVDYALDDGFADAHNRAVTWRQLLQQTSEWQGSVWGKPDSVDHNRQAGSHAADNSDKGKLRELEPPGTRWEYNDVRVNRLALCLTQLFRRSLAEVLRERVMDPIGASSGWEWRGYDNARLCLDGRSVESVSGGGHWGGGLFISAEDHARVGLLLQRGGQWEGRQLISRRYLDATRAAVGGQPAIRLHVVAQHRRPALCVGAGRRRIRPRRRPAHRVGRPFARPRRRDALGRQTPLRRTAGAHRRGLRLNAPDPATRTTNGDPP